MCLKKCSVALAHYESGGSSARAHVQMYPTYNLCDMHQYSVSDYPPNLVAMVEPFLSYSLATHFDALHAARATCQADPPPTNPIRLQSIFIEFIYPSMKREL